MDQLEKKVQNSITKYSMFKPGETVIVAVSGGPDSVGLMHVLLNLQSCIELTLIIAHCNHKLRGEASNNDAQLVKQLALNAGLAFYITSLPVKQTAQRLKSSLETTARNLRYEYFFSLKKEIHATKIATGHTMNDQAETFLMRMLRGAGKTGLASILPIRNGIVRPLLEISRTEIQLYVKRKGLKYSIDQTNKDTRFTRNKVRHRLLPYLARNFSPAIISVLAREAEIFHKEDEVLELFVDEYFTKLLRKMTKNTIILDKKKLAGYNEYFVERILRRSLKMLIGNLQRFTTKHLQLILGHIQDEKNKLVFLPQNVHVEVGPADITITKCTKVTSKKTKLLIPGITYLENGLGVEATLVKRDTLTEPVELISPEIGLLDYAELEGPLFVRAWKHGDRFRPLGLKGTKKIKDFLIDKKLSLVERKQTMVVECKNEIVWLACLRISDFFKIRHSTKTVLKLAYIKE